MTTTKGTELARINNFKQTLNSNYKSAIINLMGDEKKALRFLSILGTCLTNNPKLLECTQSSLISASLSCADLQLYPSNVAGEAYIIPYKGVAQFQIGFQGYQTLFYRAGGTKIEAHIVYKNDECSYHYGLNPNLVHVPVKLGEEKGEAIGVYSVAMFNGEKLFLVMEKEEIMKHKAKSPSANSEYSPWNPKNDPQLTMWKKTVIKQLAKSLPKNETINKALSAERGEYSINDMPTVTSPKSEEAKNLGDSMIEQPKEDEPNEDKQKEALQEQLQEANKK